MTFTSKDINNQNLLKLYLYFSFPFKSNCFIGRSLLKKVYGKMLFLNFEVPKGCTSHAGHFVFTMSVRSPVDIQTSRFQITADNATN